MAVVSCASGTTSGSLFLRARIGDDDPRLLFEVVAVAGEQQCLARELFGLRGIAFLQMASRAVRSRALRLSG